MTTTTVERRIKAPEGRVFQAIAEPALLADVIPDVLGVEFLGEQRSGAGTRFRETRRRGKKESVTELEITEFESNRHVRFIADSHGTVWDTVFTVDPAPGVTTLSLTMDARAHKLLPKLLNPLVKGLIQKGLEKHMDAVKSWCEG